MATKELKNIFLSASIPFKERHEKYYNTADIIAIRDSVIALASLRHTKIQTNLGRTSIYNSNYILCFGKI